MVILKRSRYEWLFSACIGKFPVRRALLASLSGTAPIGGSPIALTTASAHWSSSTPHRQLAPLAMASRIADADGGSTSRMRWSRRKRKLSSSRPTVCSAILVHATRSAFRRRRYSGTVVRCAMNRSSLLSDPCPYTRLPASTTSISAAVNWSFCRPVGV